MVVIRDFQLDDIGKVVYIADISLIEEYDEELFFTLYSAPNSKFLVAIKDIMVVGFICGIFQTENKSRILMLAVHPLYRRQGIGSSLLETFLNISAQKNVKKIFLEVRPTNHVALNFYRKRDFIPVEILEDFYTDGESGIKMVKYML